MTGKSHVILPGFDWTAVDDVLLDMDGTLLDRHFDNYFFEIELPRRYAAKHGVTFDEAQEKLLALYRSIEGELAWTDLHYWSRLLDMDLVALTTELGHMIGFLPDAVDFLRQARERGKRLVVLTNAHPAGVDIKVARTGLDRHVDRIVDAFQIGYLKMRKEYWPICRELVGFHPARSLYVDDDESCLHAARGFGIGFIVQRSKSSSQLPPMPSAHFPSIETFHQLLDR